MVAASSAGAMGKGRPFSGGRRRWTDIRIDIPVAHLVLFLAFSFNFLLCYECDNEDLIDLIQRKGGSEHEVHELCKYILHVY